MAERTFGSGLRSARATEANTAQAARENRILKLARVVGSTMVIWLFIYLFYLDNENMASHS